MVRFSTFRLIYIFDGFFGTFTVNTLKHGSISSILVLHARLGSTYRPGEC